MRFRLNSVGVVISGPGLSYTGSALSSCTVASGCVPQVFSADTCAGVFSSPHYSHIENLLSLSLLLLPYDGPNVSFPSHDSILRKKQHGTKMLASLLQALLCETFCDAVSFRRSRVCLSFVVVVAF